MINTTKKSTLLIFAGALLLSTPLNMAMNLQEQKYQKIDELRSAYFYTKQSYSKNKDKEIRRENIKNLATYSIHENEKNNYGITYHDIMPKISDDIAQMHINYLHLIEISEHNNEYSEPIIYYVKTLHDYYQFLRNQKNIPCGPESVIELNNVDLTFKWPFLANSSEKFFFLSLLEEQERKLSCTESNLKNFGRVFCNREMNDVWLLGLPTYLLLAIFFSCKISTINNLLAHVMCTSLLLFPVFWMLLSPVILEYIINYYFGKKLFLRRIINAKTTSCHILTDEESTLFKTHFEQLYWKAKNFVEKNKNQEFIKNFTKNKHTFLHTLIVQEEDFLFTKENE